MQRYMIGIVVLGYLPLLYCFIYYCGDVLEYLAEGQDAEDIILWQVRSKYCIVRNSGAL